MAAPTPTSSVMAYSGSSYATILSDPVEDPGAVLLGDADEFGDGLERQFDGDLGDEADAVVGAFGGGGPRLLGDRAGAGARGGLQAADGARGEAALDDLADPGVLGRVHVEHDQLLDVDLLASDALVEADDRGVLLGGEQLGVRGDVLDVGVAGDGPAPLVVEAGGAARLGTPPDRGGAPQLRELGERDAAAQQVGVGGVEAFGEVGAGRHRQHAP
ncbi:hypothetical protein GCM10010282_04150 [Streptomyces roseolus]|nr:hypothetical protein GCM10010282_04150 [Streptomyces roseolus]